MAKLTLTRCRVDDGQTTALSGPANVFRCSINPADYKHSFAISYTGKTPETGQPLGRSAAMPKYSSTMAEQISFTIVLDGTGVVPDTAGLTVAGQLGQLKGIVYDYSGSDHEPNVVKIAWGRGLQSFFGRLVSMNVDYTLFRASGEALRAKVALNFVSFATQVEEALRARRSSPDMTHAVTVRAGDTLPLLCQRIYRDAARYAEVARLNDLDGFRDLQPGTVLRFPPIR